MENLKLLFQMYFRPLFAMSELMDKGSWFFAAIFLFVVSCGFYFTINSRLNTAYSVPRYNEYFSDSTLSLDLSAEQYLEMDREYQKALAERQRPPFVGDRLFWFFSFDPRGFYIPLVAIALFYIPSTILLVNLFGRLGHFSVVFSRDYGTLSVCAMTAWSAAHLPFVIAGIFLYSSAIDPKIFFAMWAASGLIFGVLMIFALRVVFGVNYGPAALTVAVSWIGFTFGVLIFKFVSPFLFSPFLLLLAYFYLGGAISGGARGFGNTFRQRQDFKRHLQTATINPRDADAHVQLGLLYNQRRQSAKAFEHFTKAAEIDPAEPDANYELGKMARKSGDLQTALNHFAVVLEHNDKFSLSEVWREIGATYLDAKMLSEAKNALETFIDRRPVDPEGLYYLGRVFKETGDTTKAAELFQEAIESAQNSPDFRKNELRQWAKLAQKEL